MNAIQALSQLSYAPDYEIYPTQILVEMRGVEPLSENIVIQLSPSTGIILCFARLPPDTRLHVRYPDKFPR